MAEITITFPNELIPRIKEAYNNRDSFGVPYDLTNEQLLEAVKTDMKNAVKSVVRNYEVAKAHDTAISTILDINIE